MKLIYKWNNREIRSDTEFYFHVTEAGKCIICFQGSEEPENSPIDWLYNLMAWPSIKKESAGKFAVHYGLFRKWELVEILICGLIAWKWDKIKNFEISGYSQGGAIAILLHRFIKKNSPEIPIKTVVAGVPKIFGAVGLKQNRELCRGITVLRYKNDIVSKLAPGYFNVGQIVQIGKRNPFIWSVNDHLLKNSGYDKIIQEEF